MKFEVVTEYKCRRIDIVEANTEKEAKLRMLNPINWGLPIKPQVGVDGSVEIHECTPL